MTPALASFAHSTAARLSAGVLGAALALSLAACGSPRLVQGEGQFADCASADCVSSQAEDPERYVEPLRYVGSTHAARGRLIAVVRAEDGGEVVTNGQCYLHLRYDGALRAQQDVELWLCNRPSLIDVRAARGGGLFGGERSRERVEQLRAALLPDPERPLQQ